jgi:hypothetical protein
VGIRGNTYTALKGIANSASSVLRFTRAHMALPCAPAPETKMNVIVGRASIFAAAIV